MPGPTQLLIPPALHVDALNATHGSITIAAHTTAPTANCPTCQESSHHLHRHDVRVLADLPWCGVPVRLQITVRRFRCRNSACEQRIFAERLDAVAVASARRTVRPLRHAKLLALPWAAKPALASPAGSGSPPAPTRCCE